MNLLFKSLLTVTLSATMSIALADPAYLITHNNTGEESNAYIGGTIPSPYPTAAHATRKVYWTMVRMACYSHTVNGKCAALVKVGTNTAQPKNIGTVTMNLSTGDITPKRITNQGYTFLVNGPGEATISKN